jgi:hypothetical protein
MAEKCVGFHSQLPHLGVKLHIKKETMEFLWSEEQIPVFQPHLWMHHYTGTWKIKYVYDILYIYLIVYSRIQIEK